jgi:hypothetical protein
MSKKEAAITPSTMVTDISEAMEGGEELTPAMKKAIEQVLETRLRSGRDADNKDKTLSLKVNPETYKRLNRMRFETGRSGQDVMLEGLQLVMKKYKF